MVAHRASLCIRCHEQQSAARTKISPFRRASYAEERMGRSGAEHESDPRMAAVDLKVGSIMTRAPLTVPPECPVERAFALMRDRGLHHLPVVDHGRLVGVLSDRDLAEPAAPSPRMRGGADDGGSGDADRRGLVRNRMSVAVETVAPDDSASKACRRLLDRRLGCLPVVTGGRLAGVLSESDLLRVYVRLSRSRGHDPGFDPQVGTVMSREVDVVAPEASAACALEICRNKRIRHLPVVFEGWLVGVVSDRDLLPEVGRGVADLRKVKDLMTTEFQGVAPRTRLSEAAELMLQSGFHALPVRVNGALKGIVTSADVLRVLGTLDETELGSAWSSEQALDVSRKEE